MVNNSKVGRTKSFGRSVDPSTFVPSEDSNRASSDVHYYNYLLTIEEKPKCFVLEQPVRPSKGKDEHRPPTGAFGQCSEMKSRYHKSTLLPGIGCHEDDGYPPSESQADVGKP